MNVTTNKTLIGLSITACVILLGILSFIIYKSFAYTSEIFVLQSETKDIQASIDTKQTLEKNIERARADFDLIDTRFIQETDIPVFIEMLEDITVSKQVIGHISSVGVSDAKESSHLKLLRLRVDGTGSWTQVVRFISALESLPYALRIDSVTTSKIDSEDAPTGSWNFSADMSQYISS